MSMTITWLLLAAVCAWMGGAAVRVSIKNGEPLVAAIQAAATCAVVALCASLIATLTK